MRSFAVTTFATSVLCVLTVAACAAPPAPPPRAQPSNTADASATSAPVGGLPNPASQNCIDKGGTLTIEKRGDGGEFGVCTFDDNRQCEEWAMMRGDCPVGGIRVTGYVTPAGRYCAITGGEYKVTSASNDPNEQGTCTFKNGKTCDAQAYFDGTCSATN
jgi:putative hemolysin